MQSLKICKKCQVSYPENSDFFGHTPNGNFRGTCRVCMRTNVQNHSVSNPSLVKDRSIKRQLLQRELTTSRTASTQGLNIKADLGKRQRGLCYYCKEKINGIGELDHKTPISKGGYDDYTNLVLTCFRCNREKHNKTLEEYRIWLRKVRRSINF